MPKPNVAPRSLILRIVELRETPGLDPPGRIVRQVPVEQVDLILRQETDLSFELFDRNKVAPRVVHEAAPGESRPVDDPDARHQPPLVGQLAQRLARPDGALLVAGRDFNPLPIGFENITLGRQRQGGVNPHLDVQQRNQVSARRFELLRIGNQSRLRRRPPEGGAERATEKKKSFHNLRKIGNSVDISKLAGTGC